MKKGISFLMISVSLFVLSCKDNSITPSPTDAVRELHILKLTSGEDLTLFSEKGNIGSIGFLNNNSIYFTNIYIYGNNANGYTYAEKLKILDQSSLSQSNIFNAPSYIFNLKLFDQSQFLLECNGDIYKVLSSGNYSENVTHSIDNESSVVLDETTNELFIGTKYSENNQIYKQNLITNQKTVLIDNNFNYLFPLHLNRNKTKLIYFEQNCISDPNRGYIKVIDLQNPNNKTTLAECSIVTLLNSKISDDDKLVYCSDGRIYLIDLPTSELKLIGFGNSVDISKDGSKIVYSDNKRAIYLQSLLSNENNLITTGNLDYAYTPRFSPDGQKIIYITSEVNIHE